MGARGGNEAGTFSERAAGPSSPSPASSKLRFNPSRFSLMALTASCILALGLLSTGIGSFCPGQLAPVLVFFVSARVFQTD